MGFTLKFEWDDLDADIGNYTCRLLENGKEINYISFTDYTCEWRQKDDRECRYTRPYSFEVDWCQGWSMHEGFDYDEDYNRHLDEKGRTMGGYQGKCTHTVEDIKKWCENWLARKYLETYYDTLKELKVMKRRVKWFESQGFELEEK